MVSFSCGSFLWLWCFFSDIFVVYFFVDVSLVMQSNVSEIT